MPAYLVHHLGGGFWLVEFKSKLMWKKGLEVRNILNWFPGLWGVGGAKLVKGGGLGGTQT